MIKFIIPFILCFSFSVFSKNIDHFRGSWLCIEEHGVGFNWDRNTSEWNPIGNYTTSKYIFKTLEDSDCYGFDEDDKEENICANFYEFGEEPLMKRLYTYNKRSEYNNNTAFIKGFSLMYNFKMSEKGQFIKQFNIPGDVGDKGEDYNGSKNYKDSMMLFVGTCSKI